MELKLKSCRDYSLECLQQSLKQKVCFSTKAVVLKIVLDFFLTKPQSLKTESCIKHRIKSIFKLKFTSDFRSEPFQELFNRKN